MWPLIPLTLLFTIFNTCPSVYGLKMPFEVRTGGYSNHLARRSANLPVDNNGNAQYIGNITIGGQKVRVLLDTGR